MPRPREKKSASRSWRQQRVYSAVVIILALIVVASMVLSTPR